MSRFRAGFSDSRVAWLGALLLSMAVVLGACGSDHSNHKSTPVPTASPTPNPAVASACVASGAMGIDVNSKTGDVSIYVPAGDWSVTDTTGIYVVPLEGSGVSRATIPTNQVVNSCSVNSETGETICSADGTDVYLINGSTIDKTLTSGGSGTASFTGGSCTTCNAVADPVLDAGIVGVSLASGSQVGYQFFNLSAGSTGFLATVPGSGTYPSGLSESPAIEPAKHWLLSGTEGPNSSYGDFQIINFGGSSPQVYRYANRSTVLSGEIMDGAAVDCSTDIAVGGNEGSSLFVTDLSQAIFTPPSSGSFGTWNAPSQLQDLSDLYGGETTTGVSIAPSGHVGIMQEEFGGANFAAFSLPSTSGSGTPSVTDYVAAKMPNDPSGSSWSNTYDPHGVTAYTSPSTGKPMGVLLEAYRGYVAVVDIDALLAAPRVSGMHQVDPTYDLVANHVVTFVKVQ